MMADDLASFIESQKRKLEKERTEVARIQESEDRSRTSPRGYKPDNRHIQGGPTPATESRPKVKAPVEDDSVGGLKLGGYEKHQQKLRQERKEEYRKYLAEKNFRSTGKTDPVSTDGSKSPYASGFKSSEGQSRSQENGGDDYSFRNRRRGKENVDESPRGYDSHEQRGHRKPENLFESYEDLLQQKRAQERRYRGFDEPDFGPERSMRLDGPQYKQNSRSDGYLSRRYDDEDDESRNRPRARREKSFESKRVRFRSDDDLNDDSWVKPRRRLDYYDDEEDDEELLDWVRKRGKRPQRRNSAHLPERDSPREEPLERSKTDSTIRSQSAPLEGTGLIGGLEESRSAKARKKEQYKRELQQQMQEQADIKKREKMLRLGVERDGGKPLNSQLNKTPPDANRGSYGPPQSQGYDTSLSNHGPSSRPPPHPAIHSNPYDDPYYYYGTLEMGASQGTSLDAPRGTGQANMVPSLRLDASFSGGSQSQRASQSRNQGYTTPAPAHLPQQGGGDLSPRSALQPPGGYSSLGAGGSDQASIDKKKAAQQAYQEELRKQMQERNARKQKEKEDKERYDKRIEQEAASYNPWGKGGGGAPVRDSTGHLVANLRTLKQLNDQGINVSPRDQPPPVESRFEAPGEPYLSLRQGASSQLQASPMMQAADQLSGNVARSGFGRSDPLKEAQPQDDVKKAAKIEYQEYLRRQVEEKEKKKKEELERVKKEEEELERKLAEDRTRMQKEFEEEQEKSRKKEEEARLKNEQIKEAQEAKKREAEKKKKEMEEQRQAELKRKLDAELAAKKASTNEEYSGQTRFNSPPIPTVRKKMEEDGQDMTDFRSSSPPIPAIANKQASQGPVTATPPPPPQSAVRAQRQPEPQRNAGPDQDVLSQLTALRQQLKNEEKRVQQQIHHTSAVTKYSDMQRAPEDLGSRRGRRDVQVFERALANKTAVAKKESEGFSAADEFNRMKYEDTSSLAGEFRSKFPHPVSTNSVLDLQQQAFLMEQEDKLAELRSDTNRGNQQSLKNGQTYLVSGRPASRGSLLESESQFLAVDDPRQMLTLEQMSSRPRQSSARERRRWKQLEEMAKNPKPNDAYKPPTPGGFSLNSVTSFNVDEVATRNEERLRRLEMIQRGTGQGGRSSVSGDPDQVLQKFMEERSHPVLLASRLSERSLEAETSFEPL